MPEIKVEDLGELGAYFRDRGMWTVTYNSEHVRRIKRWVVRILRARPEDEAGETLLPHVWTGARMVALIYGYVPTLQTQMKALIELREETAGDSWKYKPKLQAKERESLAWALEQAEERFYP